jgi:hypothetical protein
MRYVRLDSNTFPSLSLSKHMKIRIYKNILFPVVSYGCEAWFLTLRESQRPNVIENMAVRKISWPRSREIT